jgi:hypothetical protein
VKGTEPEITVYKVALEDENSLWEESFASKEVLKAFLKGVKAALSFTNTGCAITPPIPEID